MFNKNKETYTIFNAGYGNFKTKENLQTEKIQLFELFNRKKKFIIQF